MAFKMKGRPIIQGTSIHKASVAKAKSTSIVAQSRTKADAALTAAGQEYGKSLIGKEIDFTIEQPEIKIPDSDKEKKKKDKLPTEKMTRREREIDSSGPDLDKRTPPEYNPSEDFDWSYKPVSGGELDVSIEEREIAMKAFEAEKKKKAELIAKKEEKARIKAKIKAEREAKNAGIRERNEARKYFKNKTNQPETIEEKVKALREIKAAQQEVLDSSYNITEEDSPDEFSKVVSQPSEKELDKIAYKPQILPEETTTFTAGQLRRLDKKWENSGPNVRANLRADGYVPKEEREKSSAMQMRDDRIWRNAVKGGTVHSSMRKSGYIPYNER